MPPYAGRSTNKRSRPNANPRTEAALPEGEVAKRGPATRPTREEAYMGRKWNWGQIWQMYGEGGMAQADISAQLGIQQAEVSRILQRSPDYLTWKRHRPYHRRATAIVSAAGELLGPIASAA